MGEESALNPVFHSFSHSISTTASALGFAHADSINGSPGIQE